MMSFVPQIWKSLRTQSTKDISWLMLLTTLISVTSYEIYAAALGLLPVVIMNGMFIISAIVLMAIKYRFDGMRT